MEVDFYIDGETRTFKRKQKSNVFDMAQRSVSDFLNTDSVGYDC